MSSDEPQLSTAAKQRIRAEEIFREEVRRELRPEKSTAAKVRGAFNKPLMLWFLSSVVLGGLSWSYSGWEEKRAVRAQNHAEIVRLDIEVRGRLTRSSVRLEAARDTVGLLDAIDMLNKGAEIFPDLDNRPLEGLLLQLIWLAPDEEKADLEIARGAYQELRKFRNTSPEKAADAIAQVKRDYLSGYFRIRKWRD